MDAVRVSTRGDYAARALLSEINQTVVFSTRKFADDRFGGTYKAVQCDRHAVVFYRPLQRSDTLLIGYRSP